MSPMAAFSALISFWLLHIISVRILNRKKQVKGPRAVAQLQHAAVSLLHAMLSIAAGVYLLFFRDIRACSGRTFCFNEISWLLMDLHVGFVVYELLFYHNLAKLLRPQYGMVLLHHALYLLAYLLTKLYPCKLTLELQPYYELAVGAAEVFEALRMVLNQTGAQAHVHFNNLMALMASFAARGVSSALLAWKAYTWVKVHNLWTLDLPEDQGILNIPYGLLFIAGSVVMMLIYLKWFVEATDRVNNLVDAINRQRARAEAREQEAAGKGSGRGNGRERKQQ